MKKSAANEIKRGQAISFRVPSDTPDHLLKHLQKLKESERRNFSSKIAEFVMQGVSHSSSRERETITIPLPHKLSKSQRDWLKHEHSEALLGSIIYQLLTDPIRATTLLASLNSKSVNIDEALYLQEEPAVNEQPVEIVSDDSFLDSFEDTAAAKEIDDLDDDLDSFDWETAKKDEPFIKEDHVEKENELDSLLGDFLASMNK
ncbi:MULTISPECIES: hypothetical protein [unclassified Bacillus (in: firmicutes)]|uniref:hypothetical protein n=1 Tax=unclassified Bacillus (in: firmicutes) TaxID=185979 RepID=UPI0008DF26B0|nr:MULTISPECIES: hypothetical protein [unclassified Bacillus (in: firmicutes)]SFB02135.1 hypothetical protein SAMN02799634_10456 [Bacillus sp. UNCCL13]SFQ89150.1 hypothetical protein SAMN04488577_3455 [Bacillus sp. cl95]